MTKAEYKRAFELASGPADKRDFTALENGSFDGFGCPDFKPICCTVAQLASLISWQARQFNGGWDADELTEIMQHGRRAFQIVG